MTDTQTITDGTVVQFHYTLTTDDGTVVDTSQGSTPLAYLHGAGNIVPGLERQMTSHVVGDKFTAVVPPEEGYGPRQEMPPQPVPRSQFPADMEIAPGMAFHAQGPNGEQIQVFVAGVEEDNVLVDINHPLAGATLNFEVEITDIRAASEEEIAHGHPHGPGGHDH